MLPSAGTLSAEVTIHMSITLVDTVHNADRVSKLQKLLNLVNLIDSMSVFRQV